LAAVSKLMIEGLIWRLPPKAQRTILGGTDLGGLREKWRRAARFPRIDSAAGKMIDVLAGYPILDVGTVEKVAAVSNQAARLAVMQLEKGGVVRRTNTGKRNRAWEAVGLFELIDSRERRLRGQAST
jgi:hypothetical protein